MRRFAGFSIKNTAGASLCSNGPSVPARVLFDIKPYADQKMTSPRHDCLLRSSLALVWSLHARNAVVQL
jgi:hypothetical protein